ncbi:MAG: trimeric intracellular cation channel family protein [Paracoccaceae bacterium]|nr:trimeric intracellular cation channel family protein [Paracoccaceae bacterium]MDE3239040.1 trimeric intracellular cation channel family protein [Paracoccaceae bacterium]
MTNIASVLSLLDLASSLVFAVTGALVASRKQMDIVGFLWLGMVTGVGGGTLRDLLLRVPVFWVVDPTPVAVCLGAAAVVHFSAHWVTSRYRLLLYLDAFGMALVCIAGTAKGLDAGAGPLVALVMGVITAAVGGILRDLLGQEPSIVLRREIYVSAAAAGSALFLLSNALGTPRLWAMAAGLLVAFAIRSFAIRFDWALPIYRPRPGRIPDQHGNVK